MRVRQQEILKELLFTEKDTLLIHHFATEFNCSEKTIRNDLQEIENDLKNFKSANLIRKPGVGISLQISKEDKKRLITLLYSNQSNYLEKLELTGAETQEVTYRLLMERNLTVRSLSQHYFVSTPNMRRELEKIGNWLTTKNIKLKTKQRVGLMIEGMEQDIRMALISLDEIFPKSDRKPFLFQTMHSYEISRIESSVYKLLNEQRIPITDESIIHLIFYVMVMIKRIKTGHTLEIKEQQRALIQGKREFSWMKEIGQQLEHEFQLTFSQDEIIYLTMQLLGAKLSDKHGAFYSYDIETEKQAERITDILSKRLSILALMPFNQDARLKKGLHTHFYSVLHRLKYDLPLKNPLVSDIKQMYPFMFDAIITTLAEMKEELPSALPEDEVAFLTLHYQAAVERIRSKNKKMKRVAIVCHMGVGVSEILRSKLQGLFQDIEIIATLSQNDLKKYLKHKQVDFIITTMWTKDITIPQIIVSPLLTDEDKQKLRVAFSKKDSVNHETVPILKQLMDEKYIFIHGQFEHRFTLIEKIADRLHHDGIVERDYGHQALLRERAAATAIGGGIAIPHGSPGLVKESKIVVATLDKPMMWGTEMVTLVFFLVLKHENSDKRRRLFHQLSRLAGNPEMVAKITAQTDREQLIELLI